MKNHRRLRRVLRFCLVGFLGTVLLVAGATWWTHRHLTRLTVEAVNRAFPKLELSAKTVAFTSTGELELKAIRLRVRGDDSTAVLIPSAQVRFSWQELQQQFIREIDIEQPNVRMTDALLAALDSGADSSSEPAPGTPWRIGKLTVHGGAARIELAALPTMRFGFTAQMSESATTGNHLTINALRVRVAGEEMDALALSSIKISASPEDLRRGKLREVVLDAPQVNVTDRLLAMLPKTDSQKGTTPAWSCERLSVQRGQARIDLAAWPAAEFDFSVNAEQIAAEGGGAFEITLAAISARLRGDETPAFSMTGARVAGTMSGLGRGTIREITIENPQVTVTDRLLALIPPPPAGAPATTPAPSLPWKVERLAIKRGQVRVDLAGAPLAEFGIGARLQDATLAEEGTGELQAVEVLDLALRTRQAGVEPFLRVPAIRAEFRLPELLQRRRLARISVEHLAFRYNAAFREMIASGAKPTPPEKPPTAAEKAPPATIGELRLTDGRIHLDDLGLGVPGIECRLETAFRELALEPGGGQGGQELQTVELSQIALRSPLDPFFTVLDLDTVFVRFTLAGVWRREIQEVAIVRPTLAIGPDLFWYIDRVQQNQTTPPPDAPAVDDGPPWSIQKFSAKSGQLVLALEGQARVALPMPFESHAENLNFRRLSDLRLKLQIDMPEQDYDYPGYELALRGLSGRIEFSLPPAKGSNNVVNTLRLRGVQWKNFRGRDVFLDVTYDERGVYGNLSGNGYTGLLRGQFNFLLTPESDWNGWVSGTHIDLKPITAALAPEKFSLSSPADFRLTVTARAREILTVKGDFKARAAGEMRIGKLDEFIRDLPGDWSGVKRGLSRISLETLRDFAYDTAHGDFSFNGLVGAVHLDLRGRGGSRKIEMNFHEAATTDPERVATNQP